MSKTPTYVGGHGLLEGKNVLVTAAAGTGIGFATAIRCVEEGAGALVISDIHERRLGEAADKIEVSAASCRSARRARQEAESAIDEQLNCPL